MSCLASRIVFVLFRVVCLWAVLSIGTAIVFAQAATDKVSESPPPRTVTEAPPADVASLKTPPAEPTPPESTQLPAPEPFQLPAEHHPWARFQPGAWRELQTVTETFDEARKIVSRNVTTQKEMLQTITADKYVLKVQATVDLGGKRIVGDWKIRTLQLATDGAGPIADSRRIEDQTLRMAGREVVCQVFEIRYRDGAQNLIDRVYYDPQHFPFVLLRETFNDTGQAEDGQKDMGEAEQRIDVTAQEFPYPIGEQLFACSSLRTLRHRPKGDTRRSAFINKTVPGGEVAVWSSDFDAEGSHVLRWSVTTLLAFGETSPDAVDSP